MQLKFPPPLIFTCCAVLIWALPGGGDPYVVQTVAAGVVGVLSCIFAGGALWHFHQEKTTLDPRHPAHARALVTSGIYRLSRNPMYLALAGLLAAESLWLNQWLGFAVVGGFVWGITRWQILPEEQILTQKFGKAYQDYKKHVPRWLW